MTIPAASIIRVVKVSLVQLAHLYLKNVPQEHILLRGSVRHALNAQKDFTVMALVI